MTLCLAWGNQNGIHFASDSRGGTDENYIDTLIKVMDIRVRIETPVENGVTDVAYEHTLGLCFSGSTLNSLVVKEHISESLRHLQFAPGFEEISLENICITIGNFLKTITSAFSSGYGWEPETVFLVGGFCPVLNLIAVYRLELYQGDEKGDYELSIERMMEDPDEICYIGSGQEHARDLIEQIDEPGTVDILRTLRDICLDDNHPDVGGFPQFGKFEDKDFVLRGLKNYQIDENDEIRLLYTYRGLIMHEGDFAVDETQLQVRMKYLCPFEKEINAYFDRKING